MKKRLLLLVLVFSLLLGSTALAAENSTENFVRTKTYDSQFSDLTASSVFYDNVAALYEYGLSIGKTDGTFGLKDSMTVGEIVIFAARIRSLYQYGDAETGAGSFRQDGMLTYQPYLLYLQAEGVLGDELDGTYGSAATRAQVAHVLAGTLPSSALPAVNEQLVTQAHNTGKFISDVTSSTAYSTDILTLYECGVSCGSDSTGSFQPSAAITRGAAAAMLTRMVDASLRVTPTWDISTAYSASGLSWSSLITGTTTYVAAPATESEMQQDIAYMLSKEQNTLTLSYGQRLSTRYIDQVMNLALNDVKEYCEQLYNSVSCSYDAYSGTITMTFGAVSCSDSQLSAYRDYTLAAAIAVHDQLWADGTITSDMTDYQKAKVYYTWICDHCTYDYSASEDSISHIAYALFKNGSAVCDGYTGAYNLLLKLEGIDCYALSNSEHIWTVATLDGTEYHIDTTWGDSTGSTVNYNYFAMTAAQSWNYHRW
jgi:Uncharacterized protein involved in cytokinesis, contains TGc (transglutaminase/protease-like) domain